MIFISFFNKNKFNYKMSYFLKNFRKFTYKEIIILILKNWKWQCTKFNRLEKVRRWK